MEDPNQAASQAAGRQDRALQEKYRAKIQSGAFGPGRAQHQV